MTSALQLAEHPQALAEVGETWAGLIKVAEAWAELMQLPAPQYTWADAELNGAFWYHS